MENNKSEFKATGIYFDGWARVYEIQVSYSGDAARYRMAVAGRRIITGHWQEVRFSKRDGNAYIVAYGKRLYLHQFQKV